MPTDTLTDHKCRSTQPGAKEQKLFDGGGLYLWISPKGAKVWRQAYRFNGKSRTHVHGDYPLVSLKDARAKRDELKRKLLDGMDPAIKAAPPPPPAEVVTLAQASEIYWDGKKDISDDYRGHAKRGIELHLGPMLGKRPIGSITRDELLAALNVLDAAGKHEYVRKVRMWSSQVWHWAVQQKHATENVPDQINPKRAFGKKKVKSFPALRERELPALWQQLELEGDILSVLATRMLAYTWVRTKEMRFMEWDEIDAFAAGGSIDIEKPWIWEIPEGKMKRAKALLVPLPRQARLLLVKLRARSRGSKYVFPAEHRLDRPMSDSTVLMLLYRLGYKGDMTGHGFRSVGSTWANERGYNWDHIERQLAHVPENKIRGIYNKAEYIDHRRKLLQDFADWLDTLERQARVA